MSFKRKVSAVELYKNLFGFQWNYWKEFLGILLIAGVVLVASLPVGSQNTYDVSRIQLARFPLDVASHLDG